MNDDGVIYNHINNRKGDIGKARFEEEKQMD
jgi:hypothetical protein